ncbi:transmembrane and coiled-coil domains protein 2 isoform X2 [Malaya genurostris]|uniref:transmembrane and coiled-coil domains protein 2 isoform X2 n=1 Tax=Malaya genurostris TaxID=325434 RepID=UPI0026F3B3C4|nr:transmembrane and coiled-coil domains protein 2 isoform X2 [Malaya genurostris]
MSEKEDYTTNFVYSSDDDLKANIEETDGNITTISHLSNESNEIKEFGEGHIGTGSLLVYNRITTKIACTRESIKKEQTARDANVNEYLKLAASADKQQLQRIKAVFEKKNQKSAHNILQLQKKLESYNKRYKDFQYYHTQKQHQNVRQPREMLRDVGQGLRNVGGNIRDGVSGLSATVMSKPREFAHLIKNKFGSADNINQFSSTWYADHKAISINRNLNAANALDNTPFEYEALKLSSEICANTSDDIMLLSPERIRDTGSKYSKHESECTSVSSDSIPLSSAKHQLVRKRRCANYKAMNDILDDFKLIKTQVNGFEILHKDIAEIAISLDTERYRAERLEEQLNDLTELHQVSKMEHMSQQQYVTVEGIDNSNARAVVVKLINIVLTVLQVVLLLVATAAGVAMPFLKTRVRVMSTVICIFLIMVIFSQWSVLGQMWIQSFKSIRRFLKL